MASIGFPEVAYLYYDESKHTFIFKDKPNDCSQGLDQYVLVGQYKLDRLLEVVTTVQIIEPKG